MEAVEEFAHGSYGDYSGVVFYGPPTNGFWLDRLAISDCYIGPLFRGVLDRAWQESDNENVPRLASEWNTLKGWEAAASPTLIQPADAMEFVEALTRLGPADVLQHCAGCTVEECLRCAVVIREFIVSRVSRGIPIFIEND